jgi:pimeloyl-ACP methyl ester carboxylesterase
MRSLYLHGFASGPASSKAQFFRRKFEERRQRLEILHLDEGDFEHLTVTRQLGVIEREARGEAVALIGSSMGGYLAALYAARHPEVSRLVLLAPAFGFARRWPESLGADVVSRWKETGTRPVFHYGEKRQRALSYELLEDGLKYEDDPAFEQPALIFHGKRDDTVPASFSLAFARNHPKVTLEILDSGHELLDVLDPIWSRTSAFLFERDER